jgi:RNA-directed DNA polymerase
VGNRHGRGEACLLRSADDGVGAFEDQAEAERCYSVRGQRLEPGGRELSGAQTRLIPCRRHRQAGQTRGAVLGCACRWGQERQGREHLIRRTARKKRRASLQRFPGWGKATRHHRLSVGFPRLNATRRGSDHSDGVQGHAASRHACVNKARRLVLKWLKRRSPRPSDPWQGSTAVLERCNMARPRSVGRPKTRQAALTTSADVRQRV